MKDFKNVPYVKLKDYYKKLDAEAKAEAEEHAYLRWCEITQKRKDS